MATIVHFSAAEWQLPQFGEAMKDNIITDESGNVVPSFLGKPLLLFYFVHNGFCTCLHLNIYPHSRDC